MHELSIAASVVRTVLDAVPDRRVVAVRLEIGVLSGVVPGALEFAWDVASADTALAGARLEVTRAPVRTSCRECAAEADLPEPLPVRCPGCGSREVDVVGGQQLELTSVEVEDDVTRAAAGAA